MGLIGLRLPRIRVGQKSGSKADANLPVVYRLEENEFPPIDFLSEFPEDTFYYQALQRSKLEGFQYGYLSFYQGPVRLAVLPYFLTDFQLNTMLPDGVWKKFFSWARLQIVCVGNPTVDIGRIHGVFTQEMLEQANRFLQKKAGIVVYKGFPAEMPLPDFVRARGLPCAVLALESDYWSRLSSERRKDLKKKQQAAQAIKFVETRRLDDAQMTRVFELYLQVYARAAVKFEKLNLEFFRQMNGISNFVLAYEGDQMIGFVQLIPKNNKMVFRYVGMDYSRGSAYGLYFAMLIRIIEIGRRDGIQEIDFGATSYDFKKRLGCKLVETYLYYHHRSRFTRWILKKLRFILDPSKSELR